SSCTLQQVQGGDDSRELTPRSPVRVRFAKFHATHFKVWVYFVPGSNKPYDLLFGLLGGPVSASSSSGSEIPKAEAECPPVAQPGGRSSAVSVFLVVIAAVLIAYKVVQSPSQTSPWAQGYDPTGRWWFSTICAALPVLVLLGSLAFLRIKAHYAALLGLATT